jgi:hypothetical protein
MPKTVYDIPAKAKRECKQGSPALQAFYRDFFVNATGLIRGEVDLTFLQSLTTKESALAKDLIRRNLKLRYTHIIEGAAALRDQEAVPQLKEMLARESNLSRRLTIAGTLWRLVKDSSFPERLHDMVQSDSEPLKEAHIDQIVWLGDERAIRLLMDLLEDDGRFVRYLALSRLNEIEHKRRFMGAELPHSPDHYLTRRGDNGFMQLMAMNLTEWCNTQLT